jgi:hypothetical protein
MTVTGQATMAGRGILLVAAGLAAKQPNVLVAIQAARELLDEYPAARQAWVAEGSDSTLCKTPADVARALAHAALAGMPDLGVFDADRSDNTAALLLALAVL